MHCSWQPAFSIIATIALLGCSSNRGTSSDCIEPTEAGTVLSIPFHMAELWPEDSGAYFIKYLNSGCHACVAELTEWQKITESQPAQLGDLKVWFVAGSPTRVDAEYSFVRANYMPGFLYDSAYAFFDQNKIGNDKNRQTLLINEERIIWRGSHTDLACAMALLEKEKIH